MGGMTAAWWRRFSPPVRDAALALVVTVALLYGAYGEAHPSTTAYFHSGHHLPQTPTTALILVAVACLVLAWRRRWPVAVLGVSVAAATTYTLLGYLNGAVLVAPMAALYTVAAQVTIRRAVAYGIATLAVLGSASIAVNPLGPFGGGVVILPFMVAVVVIAGIAVANRRAYVDSIRDRAEQDARRRLDEERLRIARELHDVVAHPMATINGQAGGAAPGVSLGYQKDEVGMDGTDTGGGQPAITGNGGHGLAGMRERAAAVGGTVEAGPGAAGGFRVAARLPLGGRLADQPPGPAADQPPDPPADPPADPPPPPAADPPAADPAPPAQEGTP